MTSTSHIDQELTGWRIEASIGQLLARGWNLLRPDFIKYLVMLLLLGLPYLSDTLSPYWALFLAIFPLPEGMLMYALKRARGVEPKLEDVGRVFSVFLQLLLIRVVGGLLIWIGVLLLVIPGVYLSVGYSLAFPLVLDRGLGFWEALETSRRVVTKRWFTVFGLALVLLLINAIGVFPLIVGWLFTVPFTLCVLVALYEAALGIAGDAP